jgi:hypothetical protein
MKISGKMLSAMLAAAIPLLFAAAASAQLSKNEQKCADQMNNNARKVLQQAAKADRKCVKDTGKSGGGNATACVDGPDPKTENAKGKLNAAFAKHCVDNLPSFAIAPGGDADINAAAEGAANDIAHDIFGIDVIVGTAKEEAKCADKVIQRAGQLAIQQWKDFRKCKKDGLKGKTGAPFANAAELAAACLGGPSGPQPDVKGKIANRAAKLGSDVEKQCIGKGVSPVAALFPGECGSADDASFGQCVVERVNCRVCLALKDADGLTSADIDCDLFDDGVANGSCGIPSHLCSFDGSEPSDDSQLEICLQGVCFLPSTVAGSIAVACPLEVDVNGKRNCRCELKSFDPVVITGIGVACVDPAGPCPVGEQDCDGGNALGLDLVADHEIGACIDHLDCSNQCDTYCAGLGKAQYISGCESFCQGGARDGLACECDTLGTATCPPAATLDCPGGSCVGKDDEADQDCQCQCIDDASGGPSAAGALQCRLGTAIRVETSAPCNNTGVLVRLPPQCAPFTSETHTAILVNANEIGGTIGPFASTGAPVACGTLDSSVAAGLELVSNLAFFDSTVGDLISRLRLECQ